MARTASRVGAVESVSTRAHQPEAEAWVKRTCAAQGVAPRVTDRDTLAKVATLLGADLHPPERGKSARVELISSADGRADGEVGEDGGEDRALPRQGQDRPVRA